jgi:hypothetical protein
MAAEAVDGPCNGTKELEAHPRNNRNDYIITCLTFLRRKQKEWLASIHSQIPLSTFVPNFYLNLFFPSP